MKLCFLSKLILKKYTVKASCFMDLNNVLCLSGIGFLDRSGKSHQMRLGVPQRVNNKDEKAKMVPQSAQHLLQWFLPSKGKLAQSLFLGCEKSCF